MSRLTRDGTANLSGETKFSGANGDRKKLIFPVQLTTSRIDNHTQLTHTLLKVLTIHKSASDTFNMPTSYFIPVVVGKERRTLIRPW